MSNNRHLADSCLNNVLNSDTIDRYECKYLSRRVGYLANPADTNNGKWIKVATIDGFGSFNGSSIRIALISGADYGGYVEIEFKTRWDNQGNLLLAGPVYKTKIVENRDSPFDNFKVIRTDLYKTELWVQCNGFYHQPEIYEMSKGRQGNITYQQGGNWTTEPTGLQEYYALDHAVNHNGLDTGWIVPTLLNGWVNYGLPHGHAEYRRTSDGTVIVKGLVKNGPLFQNIFVFPEGFRPKNYSIFTVYTGSSTSNVTGRINIDSSGGISLEIGGNAYTSLEISFKADN